MKRKCTTNNCTKTNFFLQTLRKSISCSTSLMDYWMGRLLGVRWRENFRPVYQIGN